MANRYLAETAISLPFMFSAQGGVMASTNPEKIWSDRVLSVIGTAIGERVHRSEYGSDVYLAAWGSVDVIKETIESKVKDTFVAFLPTLILNDVQVTWEPGANIAYVNILYTLPSQEEVNTLVGVATLTGDLAIYEENK
jgi:phage baseplate assembly protein W